jgi:hypothetical protein
MPDHSDRLDLLRASVRAPAFNPNLASIEAGAVRARIKRRSAAVVVSFLCVSLVGVALAGLSGLLRHHSAPVAGGSTEAGGSYSDHGVPVTYVPIFGTLHTGQGARVTQAPGIPVVSQRDAVAAASLRPHQIPLPGTERPASIETAFVELNGRPRWMIAKEMGYVCPHVSSHSGGVVHSTPVCINYTITLINATTGVRISAFGGGTHVPIPQLGTPPLPKLIEMYAGGSGRAARAA